MSQKGTQALLWTLLLGMLDVLDVLAKHHPQEAAKVGNTKQIQPCLNPYIKILAHLHVIYHIQVWTKRNSRTGTCSRTG